MRIQLKHILFAVVFSVISRGFAQEKYTDKEIGLNIPKITKELNKRQYGDKAIINMISRERDNAILEYENMLEAKKHYKISSNLISKSSAGNCFTDLPQIEKDALVDLYNSTSGADWSNNSGWLDFTACNWYGVIIQNGHVVGLDLFSNNLFGAIPSTIDGLQNLQIFDLGSNFMTSVIPNEFGNLINLEYINLYNNDLDVQQIPNSLSNLFNLIYLNLSNNNFIGTIPGYFGNLTSLNELNLGNNELNSPIPNELGNLSNLKKLTLGYNNFDEEIPFFFGEDLIQLETLNLSWCNFFGTIPLNLASLPSLRSLVLVVNNLSGSIPQELANNYDFRNLNITENYFFGDIPYFNSPNFRRLSIDQNKFRFKSFEDEFQSYSSSLEVFEYGNQKWSDSEETITVSEGSAYTFTMFNDDFFSENTTFKWREYLNGPYISGATERNYTITNTSNSDTGSYYCVASNPNIPNLFIIRNPIHIIVDDLCSDLSASIVESLCGQPRQSFNSKNNNQITNDVCLGDSQCFTYQFNNPDASAIETSWTFTDPSGVPVFENVELTPGNPTIPVSFTELGTYTLTLNLTHVNSGCVLTDTQQFTVTDCDPCDDVALIIDESGSISEDEAVQIRAGLRKFVEDQLDSGLNISIIGMSDSDIDMRAGFSPANGGHIIRQKVTTATKPMFDQWIANYGNRDGSSGISGSSDYWASALSVVQNNLSIIPELVMIFTDGSQTNDIDMLATQINWVRDNSNLYVYGIDGYYVNGDPSFGGNDPNAGMLVANDVVYSLRTSLDYLFGSDDPIEGYTNLITADYFAYEDFYNLNIGETILSNLMADSGILCTETVDVCYDCYTFQPKPNKSYWISGWVKEDLNIQVVSYSNASLKLLFLDASDIIIENSTVELFPSGDIIDGWQRISGKFIVPEDTVTFDIQLYNHSENIPVYFDDIRVHPENGSMKSFVYDPVTYRLMAELDENNYSTYYEYDNEGGLVRVKKETAKGVKTIQETRSGTVINGGN